MKLRQLFSFLFALLLIFSCANSAFAYGPTTKVYGFDLGKPITVFNSFSGPKNITAIGDTLYFSYDDGIHGEQLWKFDSVSDSEPQLLMALSSAGNSAPGEFVQAGNHVYFSATDSDNGRELWVTDGTTQGTHMVKDLIPGVGADSFGGFSYNPSNDVSLFYAHTDVKTSQLWRSDSTQSGTYRIFEGTAFETAIQLVIQLYKNQWFLYARPDGGSPQLFVSDGSKQGTAPFASTSNLTQIGHSAIPRDCAYSIVFNDLLYFTASTAAQGSEIWVSDGTDGGTHILLDINPDAGDAAPGCFVNLNGQLAFFADDGTHGWEPWISDGSALGTHMVMDINQTATSTDYSAGLPMRIIGNKLYFPFDDGVNGIELWVSDGSAANTKRIKDINPDTGRFIRWDAFTIKKTMSVFNDKLIYRCGDNLGGAGYCITDGSASGTLILGTLYPPSNDPLAIFFDATDSLIVAGNTAYMHVTARDTTQISTPYVYSFWKTDGTRAGTVEISNIIPGGAPNIFNEMASASGHLYFNGYTPSSGAALWQTDGTLATTFALPNKLPKQSNANYVSAMSGHNGTLYFDHYGGTGVDLYKSNGTPQSTGVIANFLPFNSTSNFAFYGMKSIGNRLVLDGYYGVALANANVTASTSYDSSNHYDLFSPGRSVLNGAKLYYATNSGVNVVNLDSAVGDVAGSSGNTEYLALMGGYVYVSGYDKTVGQELFKIDPKTRQTQLVKDIREGVSAVDNKGVDSSPKYLTAANGKIFFSAYTDGVANQLWVSDGNDVGTMILQNATYNTTPLELTEFNNTLFYTTLDGSSREMWISDGNINGTRIFKSLDPSAIGGANDFTEPYSLIKIGAVLYFSAVGNQTGRELWRSDGTQNGTYMVKDIFPGPASASPFLITPLPDQQRFLFKANNGVNGEELWISDGSAAGTMLVADLEPGPGSSSIYKIAYADGYAYVALGQNNSNQNSSGIFSISIGPHSYDPNHPGAGGGSGAPNSGGNGSSGHSGGGSLGLDFLALLILLTLNSLVRLIGSYRRNLRNLSIHATK